MILTNYLPIMWRDAINVAIGYFGGAPLPVSAAQGASGLLSGYLQRRDREAQEILIDEIRNGDRLCSDVPTDITIGLIFRYFTASRHGAARLNLRLLAKLISSSASIQHRLQADDFAYYSDILSSLRYEEVVLIALMKSASSSPPSMSPSERATIVYDTLTKRTVPSLFERPSDLDSTLLALGRTGLLIDLNHIEGKRYDLSTLATKLIRMVDFASAPSKA